MTRITGKTIDPGIDQDVITFRIGSTEVGRLTATSSTLGFTVGSSYLIADTVFQTGLASGAFANTQFTLRHSLGADFAIDGGDNTKINVATTCWAIIMFQSAVNADTATTTQIVVDISATPAPPLLGTTQLARQHAAVTVAVDGWDFTTTTQPVQLPSGTVITASSFATTSAGTWSADGTTSTFQIVRVA